ncbi:MAG: phosphatidate cytidylyltransferase [Cyanobacteria bacterium QH_8_48_120]|nr:MAG: phosphatidate cytidylyltransferase [Cyanobacteria bacterium QH_10_48_56]PSO57238.1 MAG: phosphatidate cytidylyltransferase [Cyanobacteria bacterium QH_7_48_89]PSO57752.1 MAG: phosphatidate cytidylyltransferase [Cyanobacteria bacterium QH_1_48_107]PSO61880.1 MAG: phosphatidate cytidylyltransferase [Cyanobacteria bacterium QH_2_48_84]PSO62092.1 MAG: phosphatidate cytidylyltransferase [Cyanobacteria bacterium QH_6_48_35]PSO71129.1 MAG: phosphatidate cytidylyltransferase [Cyanobacteria bac
MLNFSAWFQSTTPLLVPLSLIFAYLAILVLVAEGITRLFSNDKELTRKVVHLGAGNVILLAWWLEVPASVGIAASIIASLVALISYFLPILPSINSVGRQSLGTFFYAVSIGILVAWFWWLNQPQYAAMGILAMCWGDGMAAIIGQRFGKHPYQILGITKSWEGSLTMAVASYLTSSLVLLGVQGNVWQTWLIPLAVAGFATGLEAVSRLGVDNLTVPLGSAALGFFLNQIGYFP